MKKCFRFVSCADCYASMSRDARVPAPLILHCGPAKDGVAEGVCPRPSSSSPHSMRPSGTRIHPCELIQPTVWLSNDIIAAALQAPLRGALCSACVSERLSSALRMSIGSRITIPPTQSGGTWQHRSIEAAWRHCRHCGGIANLDRVPAWRWVTECPIGCRLPKRAFQNHRIPLVFCGRPGAPQNIRYPP